MKLYCGTDIIEVDRIKDAVENTKEFKENIFSQNEIDYIDSIKCEMKYQRYAGRFAAKEAIYKALSKILVEHDININFLDVEIQNLEDLRKRPKVIILNEKIKNFLDSLCVDIDVSISHIKENAIAMAIVTVNKED